MLGHHNYSDLSYFHLAEKNVGQFAFDENAVQRSILHRITL